MSNLPPSESLAKQRLCEAAHRLEAVVGRAPLSLWDKDEFAVAPSRLAKIRELRSKGVGQWLPDDFDFVLFKSMTTMGDVNTFKFILPRFLLACCDYPEFSGWTSGSHLMLAKAQMLDLTTWKKGEAELLLDALESFALFEWAIEASEGSSGDEPERSVLNLLEFVGARRSEL